MTKPRLRAREWSGAVWDDPSEVQLHDLLADMNLLHRFVIVERLDVPDPSQHYMQVYLNDDKTSVIEYREGSADLHYRAVVSEPFAMGGCDIAASVLQGWAFEREGWRGALAWVPWDVEEERPREGRG
ncbi:hypothetical protein [Streptomyces sp. 8N616]|uniref:hypothetical protein n=1 Tax=Streptomyces sp. 8N616 TaxID=3457414 RepID=UPI003FD1DA61